MVSGCLSCAIGCGPITLARLPDQALPFPEGINEASGGISAHGECLTLKSSTLDDLPGPIGLLTPSDLQHVPVYFRPASSIGPWRSDESRFWRAPAPQTNRAGALSRRRPPPRRPRWVSSPGRQLALRAVALSPAQKRPRVRFDRLVELGDRFAAKIIDSVPSTAAESHGGFVLFALGEAGHATRRGERFIELRLPFAGATMLLRRIEQVVEQHGASLDVGFSSSTSRARIRAVGGS